MKRLIALAVLLLLGFFVGWPAWSGYQIATALRGEDAATLERKIVFEDVRRSLRPAAEMKIGEVYDKYQAQAGPAGAVIVGQIKNDVVPKIAETALRTLVTPRNLIRLVNDGRSLKDGAERILQEQVGKIGLPGLPGQGNGGPAEGGGLGGIKLPGGLADLAGKLGLGNRAPAGESDRNGQPSAMPAAPAEPTAASGGGAKGKFGVGNIKSFALLGPLGFELGVAKDAASGAADVMVEMRFINGDWRVTGVRPRL